MNTTSGILGIGIAIFVIAVIATIVLPEGHPLNPMTYIRHEQGGLSDFGVKDMVPTNNEQKVPLYVYVGTPVTSRKWSSFYDRRHTGARSPLLDMIAMTHRSHHKIGPIIPIDDDYLMNVLNAVASKDTIRTIAGKRGQVSLQHDRMLRDALLCYVVCKGGGILIPCNTILMRPTGIIWEELLKTQKDTLLVFSDNGNTEYGCPIIVTRPNVSTCEILATTLFGAGANTEFSGGVTFNGGSSVIIERLKSTGLSIQNLNGVNKVHSDELVEIKPLSQEIRSSVFVVIPFEQGSGKTSISRRDEWLYSDSPESILKNPTVLREIFVMSHKNALGRH